MTTNIEAQDEYNSQIENSFYMDKFQRDVLFFAYGEYPTWSLELTHSGNIELNIAPDKKIAGYNYSTEYDPFSHSQIYYATFDNGFIQINILEDTCASVQQINNIAHKVMVHYHDTLQNEYLLLNGCAKWIPDFRLNDIYMLSQFDQEKISLIKDFNIIPRLEFHLNNYTITGSTGIHELDGSFVLDKNIVYLKNIHLLEKDNSTLTEFENLYLNSIQNKAFEYKINEGVLILVNSNHTIIFNRTD
ncbi:MAG: hypothetical protein LC105_00505 [Chitinophagales bacterium]|nr:hypothetical protein [Chitinophagales bacterium]